MAEINDLNITDASNTARFPEGMAPSAVNDGARALEGLVARWHENTNTSIATTGSSNAYILAAQGTQVLFDGLVIGFDANHANTGASTINVDSTGVKNILKHNDVALASGDIEAGQKVIVVYDGTSFQMVSQLGNSSAGAQTIWIPSVAMRPTSSNSCADITDVETTSGRPDLQVLDFDASADEHAQFQIGFPKSWNESTITFRVFWASTATDSDGVAWGLQGVSVANDGTIDVAFGTAIVVTDDNISAAEDCLVTATSGSVTIASAAVDTMTFFRIFRDVSNANDDMAEDARLIGVQIFYTTDAVNDD